jgi:hypothetical protein
MLQFYIPEVMDGLLKLPDLLSVSIVIFKSEYLTY